MTRALVWCMGVAFGVLPRGLLRILARAISALWFYVIPVRRAWAEAHLAAAFTDMVPAERRRIVRLVFLHQAQNTLEMLAWRHLWRAKSPKWVRVEGREHLEAARAAGPVVILTAHCGNFDLLACHEARVFPLSVVSKTLSWKALNKAWMDIRTHLGLDILPATGTLQAARIALTQGRVVALVLDQHSAERRAVEHEFLGIRARTSAALATLAVRNGATIVPAFGAREKGVHVLRYQPALQAETDGDARTQVAATTLRCLEIVEAEVRARPEQWLWLHRRWKTREGIPLVLR